jgi:hypothetical protein
VRANYNSQTGGLFLKLALCTPILLTCMVVVTGANLVSHEEYFFSHPAKRDTATRRPVNSLPAFSAVYFRLYQYSWIVPLIVFAWALYLVVRNGIMLEHIAIFAAWVALACALLVALSVVAIYLCNQTFVFNGQHLR